MTFNNVKNFLQKLELWENSFLENLKILMKLKKFFYFLKI